MRVGEVEGAAVRPAHVYGKQPGLGKALRLREAEVGAQGRFQTGEQVYIIRNRVVPVARAFAPGAIGGKLAHRKLERLQRIGQNLAGDVGKFIGDGQSPDPDAAVADLVPVVVARHPPAVTDLAAIALQPRQKPLLQHGRADFRAPLRRPGVVKPVVGDGEGVGHLGGVEEMAGIPVGKTGGGVEFGPYAFDADPVAVEQIDKRQRVDAVEDAAADAQQPQTVGDIVARRIGLDYLAGVGAQTLVPFFRQRMPLDVCADTGHGVLGEDQTRMTPVQTTQDFAGR